MKLSLVMTTYNGEKYIYDQLESIRNQQVSFDEVIICDDGSRDKTIEIISRYINDHQLSHWQIIINSENLGFVKNFRKGIGLTKGDFIFLADQDDIWEPIKTQRVIEIFRNNSDCMVLNTGYDYINSNGKKIFNFRNKLRLYTKKTYKVGFRNYLYYSNFPGFAMAFRSVLKDYVFKILDNENVYGHDIMINLLGISLGGLYYCDEILNHYRLHESNTTGGNKVYLNFSIESRIAQKEKEFMEYQKMYDLCKLNQLKHIDYDFLKGRTRILEKRLHNLKDRSFFASIKMLFNEYYPFITEMGDCIYIALNRIKIG